MKLPIQTSAVPRGFRISARSGNVAFGRVRPLRTHWEEPCQICHIHHGVRVCDNGTVCMCSNGSKTCCGVDANCCCNGPPDNRSARCC
jgi:hypothetical protein